MFFYQTFDNQPTRQLQSNQLHSVIYFNNNAFFLTLLYTFEDYRDAEDAKNRLDGTMLLGRDIGVEHTTGQRKTPAEMREKDHDGRRGRSKSRNRSRSRDKKRTYSPPRKYSSDQRNNVNNAQKKGSRNNSRSDFSRSVSN